MVDIGVVYYGVVFRVGQGKLSYACRLACGGDVAYFKRKGQSDRSATYDFVQCALWYYIAFVQILRRNDDVFGNDGAYGGIFVCGVGEKSL